MEEIVTILSTREWAIAIWGTGFFVWMLTQREIRKSLWNVIKILLGKNLRHFFLIIALYVAGITMIFYQLPFWNNIYLKDIILWLIFSGISYCVNSIIKGDAEHLKSTVKDNFRVIVIFEYFIGTFTFKFWIEMLIIPVITILILMNVVAESEEKYRRVHKLIDIVLACIGWYMLWGAANVGLKEYKELNAINTLVSFMIAVTDEEVLESWKEFFDTGTNWKDFPNVNTYEDYKKVTDKQHLSKAKRMPIRYLKASGKGFFVEKDGYALALRDEIGDVVGNMAFGEQMGDVLGYRSLEYYRRRYERE